MWRFVVSNAESGSPTWWLYAGNYEMVAWAGEDVRVDLQRKPGGFGLQGGREDRAVRRVSGRRWGVALAGLAWLRQGGSLRRVVLQPVRRRAGGEPGA